VGNPCALSSGIEAAVMLLAEIDGGVETPQARVAHWRDVRDVGVVSEARRTWWRIPGCRGWPGEQGAFRVRDGHRLRRAAIRDRCVTWDAYSGGQGRWKSRHENCRVVPKVGRQAGLCASRVSQFHVPP
jgi:hypothetical protein